LIKDWCGIHTDKLNQMDGGINIKKDSKGRANFGKKETKMGMLARAKKKPILKLRNPLIR